MILSRFLKLKWQPADPQAREPAAREPANGDPTSLHQVQQNPDPATRRADLERLDDLDRLRHLASADADEGARAAARARYQSLLAGQAAGSPPLAVRLERLRSEADPDLAAFLARQAAEPELRLAALEGVDSEPTLAEVALQDSHSGVRLAALERIQDPGLLEPIARQSRNRDKRLYRHTRERLEALAAARARSTRLERLCAEMAQLVWDGESGPNAARFPKLEQEWRDVESFADSAVRERYSQARARFLADRQASAGRRAQRLELIASLETLLERLRQESEPSAELNAAIRYATHEAPAAWAHLGSAQDAESHRLETRFQQRLQEIHDQERLLRRNHQRAERLRELLRQGEALLHQSSEVRETEIRQLRHGWDGLERPESRDLTRELQNHFDGLLDRLRARLQRQVQQREEEWRELQDLAGQLEAAAENGELQRASQIQEQARHKLKHNIGLSRAQMTAIEERLQACAGRLGELRDWQRWGAHQVREQLCATAESLIDLDAEPAEIAQRIREVREAWKVLDHREGGAPRALWKRFNTACERAYTPCQVYFEAQFEERQRNQEQKQALCAQLEQFEAATDWQRVDWREADRLCRRVQEQWRKIGPVNRSERKNLDRRFQRILKRLDAQLGAERDRELHRRRELIQQVQGLADHPDLRAAIDAVKRAQAEWHPTVQAPPRQEQALWKEFRAACDAVFDRRQTEQQAADAERQHNLARKRALCAEIEALTAIDSDDPLSQARDRLQAIRQEWEAIGPIRKAEQREIDQRFETAVRRFDQHQRTLRRAGIREAFQHLHQRARWCARLEALLASPADAAAVLAEVREIWPTLPPLSPLLQESLQKRHDAIVHALTGAPEAADDLRARLERNLEQKQIWCVSMEIFAGVESPPECAQLRMQHQVARLSASLASDARAKMLHDPQWLQQQWCLTGALPAEAEAALDNRFLVALNAWWQREDA